MLWSVIVLRRTPAAATELRNLIISKSIGDPTVDVGVTVDAGPENVGRGRLKGRHPPPGDVSRLFLKHFFRNCKNVVQS